MKLAVGVAAIAWVDERETLVSIPGAVAIETTAEEEEDWAVKKDCEFISFYYF